MMLYSVIVPIYNEEKTVILLCKKIKDVMDRINPVSYEIIFVDDGSTDKSLDNLKSIAPQIKDLMILSLDKNYGQSLAIQAGFDSSSGGIIISLDGDLQNDPDDIPRLLDKMQEGYDVVCGWLKNKHSKLSRLWASRIANFIRQLLFKERIHDVGCMFRVYTRSSLSGISLDGCKHRFLTAILSKRGVRIGEVEINAKPRLYGVSKYGIIDRAFGSMLEIFRMYLPLNKNSAKKKYNIRELIKHEDEKQKTAGFIR